jgi:hypothetical protein
MNTTTPAAMLAAIIAALDLEQHTVIFHVIDMGNEKLIASGSVMDADDLADGSDAFLDLASEYDSTPALDIPSVITYMLGTGEADAATEAEIDALTRFRDSAPAVFDDMLDQYADILAGLDCVTVTNPYYFNEEED